MSTKINSIISLDLETGDLDPTKGPIMQIAYEAFQLDDYEMLGQNSMYVKNYADLQYSLGALKANGISLETLDKKGLDVKTAMKQVCEDFQSYNTSGSNRMKPILAGHNFGFDVGFLTFAFDYCKIDIGKYLDCNLDKRGHPVPKYIDTLLLAKLGWGNSKETIKYNLTACVNNAGLPQFEAHSALSDTMATTGLLLFFTEKLREVESQPQKSTVTRENTVRKHFQF